MSYEETLDRMRAFTSTRAPTTPDEIWLLEHPPTYTLGVRARHRPAASRHDIPTVITDRGGDVTYHGPGQPILYVLIDIARRGLGIQVLVRVLEQAVIDTVAAYGISAERRRGAPGVYVGGRKIAALGLRVRGGRSYHGVALNARMDVSPFAAIDPCGYPGLQVAEVAEWQPDVSASEVGERLLREAVRLLGYTEFASDIETTSAR